MSRHHRPRKPFDWLGERKHRRGALNLIRQAIREGWLDGNEQSDRRDRLIATLSRLLDVEHLPTPEVISLCQTFLAMALSDLDRSLPLSRHVPSTRLTAGLDRFERRMWVAPPTPPRGGFSERSGRRPRRKSRFRVSDAATCPLFGRKTASISVYAIERRRVTIPLAGLLLAPRPACEEMHPVNSGRSGFSCHLATANRLLFTCSEASAPWLLFRCSERD